MAARVDESLLRQFSELLAKRVGLHFPPARWPDMLRGMRDAAAEFGFADVDSCLRSLVASAPDQRQVEVLACHLSVGETYFFRDPALFAALEREVLPSLVAARVAERRLRIWSAGSCTGEEAYSVAIVLDRLIPDIERWHVTILATDINPEFLAKAQKAIYRDWSFRTTPPALRRRCFDPSPGGHRLKERYRKLVSFGYLNLVDDVYPSLANNTNAMDLVLCRNVLMYFDAPTAAAVAARLGRAVVEGGWLSAGPAEIDAATLPDFEPVHCDGAILFRRDAHRLARPAAPLAAGAPAGDARSLPPVAPPRMPRPAATERPVADAPGHATAAPRSYQAAVACYARGDYAAAKSLLAGARDAAALALSARSCANLGELAEARERCEAAIAIDKGDAGLRYLLASVLDESGLPADALVALRQALYLDQDHILAHVALANLYRRAGDAARAARHFATARGLLAARPADAPLPDSDGLTAGRLGEIIDATRCIA
jgi:chemotaxis protein methyltransferase CheR